MLIDDLNKNKRLLDNLQAYDIISSPYITEEVINKNFLKVQIYYDSMTTTQVKQVPGIGVAEFCAEFSKYIIIFR